MGNKIDGRMHFIAKNNMNYTRNLSCKRSWKDFEFNDLFIKTHFFSFSQHKLLIFFLKCNKIPNANNLNSDFHHYHFKNASPFSYAISRFTFHISHIFSSLQIKSNNLSIRSAFCMRADTPIRYNIVRFLPIFTTICFLFYFKYFALISFYSYRKPFAECSYSILFVSFSKLVVNRFVTEWAHSQYTDTHRKVKCDN